MLSSFNNDLNAEMKTASVPFSPFPLRFGTAQRELSRMTQKIVLPAQRICSPVKPWGVLGGIDSGVNSVACNRLAFPLVGDLLPNNLLPS